MYVSVSKVGIFEMQNTYSLHTKKAALSNANNVRSVSIFYIRLFDEYKAMLFNAEFWTNDMVS